MKDKRIEEMSKILDEAKGHLWFLLAYAAEKRERGTAQLILDVINHLEDVSNIMETLKE